MKSYKYSVLLLACLLLTLLPGCAPHKKSLSPSSEEAPAEVPQISRPAISDFYAAVPPQQLDDSLTDDDIARMLTSLRDIPLEEIPLDSTESSPSEDITPSRDKAAKAYLAARYYFQKNQMDLALKQITLAVAADPQSAILYQLMAQIIYSGGKTAPADQAALQAAKIDPALPAPWQIMGIVRQNQEQFPAAAYAFKKALESPLAQPDNPLTPVIRLQFGSALAQMNYTAAAAEQYQIALLLFQHQITYAQTNPLMSQLLRQLHLPVLTLANLYLRIGNVRQAVETVQQAQTTLRTDVNLTQLFIMSLAQQRIPLTVRFNQISAVTQYLIAADLQPDQAIQYFYAASEKLAKHLDVPALLARWNAPDKNGNRLLSDSLYAYGLTLAQQFDPARLILEQALDSEKESGKKKELYWQLAQIHTTQKNWPEMIRSYDQVLRLDPDSVEDILDQLDPAAPQIQNLDTQIPLWRQNPALADSAGASFLMAYLAQQSGFPLLAESAYRDALRQNENLHYPLFHLLDLLLKQKNYASAQQILQQHQDDLQKDPKLLWFAAQTAQAVQDYRLAQKYYQSVIDFQPENLDAWLALGEVLYLQNSFQNAEQIFLHALDNWPDQPEICHQIFILYASWSNQKNIPDSFRQTAERRTRDMFARWIQQLRQDRPDSLPYPPDQSPAWQKILDSLRELTGKYPASRPLHLLLSELLAARNEIDQARTVLQNILPSLPDDPDLLDLLAELDEKQSQFDSAAVQRKKLYDLDPQDPKRLLDWVVSLRRGNQCEQAFSVLLAESRQDSFQKPKTINFLQNELLLLTLITRHYDQAVPVFQNWKTLLQTARRENPSDDSFPLIDRTVQENLLWVLTENRQYPDALAAAVEYYNIHKFDKSQSLFYLIKTLRIRLLYDLNRDLLQQLLQLDPDNSLFLLETCQTLLQQNLPDQAVELSAQAWRKRPDDDLTRRVHLLVLQQADRFDDAIRILQDRYNASHEESVQIQILDLLLSAGRYDQAESLLSQKTLEQNQSADWLEARLKLDILRKNDSAALARLEEFTQGKKIPDIEKIKIEVLTSCGQTEKAAERLKQLLDETPEELELRLRYTVLLERLGRVDQAVAELEKLLEKSPDNPVICNNLGYILTENTVQTDRARPLLEKALRIDPQSASTIDSMGWLCYKQGDFDAALQYLYQAAARMIKTDFEIWDHLGDVLYRLGKSAEARIYWSLAERDLKKRLPAEPHLEKNAVRIQTKLRDLDAGSAVAVAALWSEAK